LLFLVGGNDADVREVQPLIDAMGQKTVHVGGVGMGTSMKLVFNLMLALSMLSFSEALVLGESLGIDRQKVFAVLNGSAVAAAAASGKQQKIECNDYSPDFPLRLMQKDLELVAVSGYEVHAALPLSNTAKEIFALAMRYGLGEDDFSAIYKFLSEKKNGSE
jgi:3-hydroxyisobutyrate dehydrogenase/glyoxylate/succinic semialdehyde reductase